MKRVPNYLVIALLGLAFISAGLITMFADTSEVVPTSEAGALQPSPTPTFTMTPTLTLTPTLFVPQPATVVPTEVVMVQPTIEIVPPVAEILPSPTLMVPTEIVVVEPTVDPQTVAVAAPTLEPTTAEITPEVLVDAAGQAAAPTIDITPETVVQPELTVEVTSDPSIVPTEDVLVTLLPAGDVQAQGASASAANVIPATPVTNPNSVPVVPTAIPVDVSQPTPDITVPTSDPALLPTVETILPTSDPALVIPTIEPTSDPALLPTVETVLPTSDPALIPAVGAEATSELIPDVPVAHISGVVMFSNQQEHTGIVLMLTLPDGTTIQSITDASGTFFFADLLPGQYRVDAGAVGYLSRRIEFTLENGQDFILPPATLLMGDTNLDNVIDLSDAALIASNFDGPATVAAADVNRDGWIDVKDLALIGADFGRSGPLPWQ